MAVKLTIKNVPEQVRDKLASLAATEGESLQKFLLGELERIAYRPSKADWVRELRGWKKDHGINIPVSVMLEARDADRK